MAGKKNIANSTINSLSSRLILLYARLFLPDENGYRGGSLQSESHQGRFRPTV